MRLGLLFAALAALLLRLWSRHGGWTAILLWPALSLALVVAACLGLGPASLEGA
ncbi:MAG: hypothetical protein H6740_08395 [Alphaproteobacteria bacterium]|nr:hypothetical protein [Alphaproteobacteria bacterium]